MSRYPVRHRLLRTLWTVIATTVILVAFVISLARLFLPLIDSYRGELQQWASHQFGRPVQIGKVAVAWDGLTPVIRLEKVSVLRPSKKPWVKLKEVQIHIEVINSLLTGSVQTGRINIVGPKIDIHRDKKGAYSISGLRTGTGGLAGVGGSRALAWLLARGKVGVLKGKVTLIDPRVSKQPVMLTDVDLLLETEQGQFKFNGAANVAGDKEQRVLFVMNLDGPLNKLHTRFYMQGKIRAGPWLNGHLFRHADMREGSVNFRIWGDGHRKLERFTGDISISRLKWGILTWDKPDKPPAMHTAELDGISGRFNWERTGNGWQFDADQIRLVRAGKPWPVTSLRLVTRHSANRFRVVEGRFSFLRLQDISALLLATPGLDSQVRDLMGKMDVAGEIRGLDFRYYSQAGKARRIFAQAGFRDYGHRAWGKMPGVRGLDGFLVLNDKKGFVNVQTRDGELDMPTVFGNPLALTHLDGRFFWQKQNGGWRIDARDIKVDSRDVKATGRVSIRKVATDKSPFIDLRVAFRDGDASQVSLYLPRKVMRKQVVSWLDRSILSGRVTSGNFVYFGRPANFPFTRQKGVFDVSFNVKNMVLDYASGWPPLKKLDADVKFHNNSFLLKMKSGQIAKMPLTTGEARIDSLSSKGVLAVKADVVGHTPDMFDFLANSPAGTNYRDFLRQVRSKGDVWLKFGMQMPLRKTGNTRAQGKIDFRNSAMTLSGWDVGLSRVKGILAFSSDRHGVRYTGKNLSAHFRGEPGTLNIYTRGEKKARRVYVDLKTRISAGEILGKQGALLSRFARGKSTWLLRIMLAALGKKGPDRIVFLARSNLDGTSLKLPGKLAKPAKGTRQIEVQTELAGGSPSTARLLYQNGLAAAVRFRSGVKGVKFHRGEIGFGRAQAQLPEKKGLRIVGHLEKFSLSEWQTWMKLGGKTVSGFSPLDILREVKVQVDLASLYGMQLHELKLDASRAAPFWRLKVDSDEIRGAIRLPEDFQAATPITMKLDYLHLRTRAIAGQTGESEKSLFDVRRIPNLQITSKMFSYNGISFGSLDLLAHRSDKGLSFEKVNVVSGYLTMSLAGLWYQKDGRDISEFRLKANSRDVGKALGQLGYKQIIDDGQMDIQASLKWYGSPYSIDMFSLSGSIDLRVVDGQLLNVKQGGGKIFGLLSLHSLPRRLLLDFSDVFKKGFAFDSITGRYEIEDGDAYTNGLTMKGPSARIDISGRIGLATRDYRQEVLVTPRVTSSMPILGGILAGGPQVGVGLWVIDKLLGGKINKLSQVRYSVTGPWDNPVVSKVGDVKSGTLPSSLDRGPGKSPAARKRAPAVKSPSDGEQ